jgi:flagellar hook-length control protein FliK
MSATISSAPSPAAPVAQIAVNGAGATDTAAVVADSGAADSGVGSFGALFQQLLSRRPAVEAEPVMLTPLALSADVPSATEVNPAGTLAALMPFLEGMGLIKTDTAEASRDLKDPATQDTDDVDAAALAGIASALTPQLVATAAITAAQASAATSGSSTQTALPVIADGQSGLQAQIASMASGGKADGQAVELSSKFSAALEAAADKAAGAITTSNPAGLTAHPSGSPLANNLATVGTPLPIDQHVGAAGWSQEVGNRLVWMSNSTNSHAELVLTPPQMGRVEVSLSVTGDQATATFVSSNPVVREALEAAMPRLREILADAGIQLGQTQVGAENARQSAQQEKNGDNFAFKRDTPNATGSSQLITAPQSASSGLKMGRGLVDIFA